MSHVNSIYPFGKPTKARSINTGGLVLIEHEIGEVADIFGQGFLVNVSVWLEVDLYAIHHIVGAI